MFLNLCLTSIALCAIKICSKQMQTNTQKQSFYTSCHKPVLILALKQEHVPLRYSLLTKLHWWQFDL